MERTFRIELSGAGRDWSVTVSEDYKTFFRSENHGNTNNALRLAGEAITRKPVPEPSAED